MEKRELTETEATVLAALCKLEDVVERIYVVPITRICSFTGLSKYKVTKAIHALRDEFGYIKKDIQTEDSLWEDSIPPFHGWSLTDEGLKTEIYKQIETKRCEMIKAFMTDTGA